MMWLQLSLQKLIKIMHVLDYGIVKRTQVPRSVQTLPVWCNSSSRLNSVEVLVHILWNYGPEL